MKESKADMIKVFLNSTISISDLTRAGAKKIFENLKKDEAKIIMKNNKPIAALISTQRYQDLLEKEENLYYLNLAIERKKKGESYISREEFMHEMEIDDQFIKSLPEIEME